MAGADMEIYFNILHLSFKTTKSQTVIINNVLSLNPERCKEPENWKKVTV